MRFEQLLSKDATESPFAPLRNATAPATFTEPAPATGGPTPGETRRNVPAVVPPSSPESGPPPHAGTTADATQRRTSRPQTPNTPHSPSSRPEATPFHAPNGSRGSDTTIVLMKIIPASISAATRFARSVSG